MKTTRGKLVGLGAVVVGIGVLLVACLASRGLILEKWYLSDLQSTDEETRKKAAQALGECGTVRSIPPLMRANSDSLRSLLEEKGKPDALVGMEKNLAGMLDQKEKLARQIRAVWPDLSKLSDLSAQRQSTFLNNQLATFDARVADLEAQVATMLMFSPYSLSLRRITERETKAAVPHLLQELESDDWHARWMAVRLLGSLDPHAEDAVPGLETKTKDSNSFVRYAAAEALKTIGHEDGQ